MQVKVVLMTAGLVGGLLCIGAPAMAQSNPMEQSRYGQSVARTNANMRGSPAMQRYRLENEMERREQEEAARQDAEAQYGAERLALAEQVQALIDAGQCREAREMAVAAGERTMAVRVRQTCRRSN
jgi:hypothetical protein